jgi:phosphomannomutase
MMTAKFGTSGLRGLAEDLVGETTRRYTGAFIDYLLQTSQFKSGSAACVAWDFRASSLDILQDVMFALRSRQIMPISCGTIPTQALALWSMSQNLPCVMITGSHIPANRNGLKFYVPSGEISKQDELEIVKRVEEARPQKSTVVRDDVEVPDQSLVAVNMFKSRYLNVFAPDCLSGLRVGVYQHSTVARDILVDILRKLGADVVALARESHFIPVDTEAVSDVTAKNVMHWVQAEALHALVSADGDGDRPLVADETGRVINGDVLGLIAAKLLNADIIVTPVTSNSGLENTSSAHVIRTRVGSPFVVAGMQDAMQKGHQRIVGFEANGGVLTGTPIVLNGTVLNALPTRDSVLPILACLCEIKRAGEPLSRCVSGLGLPISASGRLENIASSSAMKLIAHLNTSLSNLQLFFSERGAIAAVNETDGLRVTLQGGEIVHFRPSGNAPEFRVYVEAESSQKAHELLQWASSNVSRMLQTFRREQH